MRDDGDVPEGHSGPRTHHKERRVESFRMPEGLKSIDECLFLMTVMVVLLLKSILFSSIAAVHVLAMPYFSLLTAYKYIFISKTSE